MSKSQVPKLLVRGSKLEARGLVKLSSLTERSLLGIERLLANWFWLLFSCAEHALFATANAFVRVQSFEDELRRRDLLLGGLFRRDAQRSQFVDQALNTTELLKRFPSRNGI